MILARANGTRFIRVLVEVYQYTFGSQGWQEPSMDGLVRSRARLAVCGRPFRCTQQKVMMRSKGVPYVCVSFWFATVSALAAVGLPRRALGSLPSSAQICPRVGWISDRCEVSHGGSCRRQSIASLGFALLSPCQPGCDARAGSLSAFKASKRLCLLAVVPMLNACC